MKISSRHLHAASSLLVAGTAASVLLVATISWSANFYRRLSELGDFSHRLHDLEAHDATLVAENEIVRRKVEPALGSFFIYEHAEIARRLLSPAVARATGDVRFRFTTPATPVETLPFTGNAVQLRAPLITHGDVDAFLNGLSGANVPGIRVTDLHLSASDPLRGHAQGTMSLALARFAAIGVTAGASRGQ